ncbi:MAG: adenylate/guanylate cyclase domain-containing protein [Gemmatimonadota bacterium]
MRSGRSFATLLFTDIVGSTERAAELGDRGWHELLSEHHGRVRREIRRFGGTESNTAGDGFLATFERPASAIRCAWAIRETLRELGLEVRAGVHAGEIEREGREVGGIAVHIGARAAAAAEPGEILVTSTAKELVTGTGFRFEDKGKRQLKGVPDEWRLFALSSLPGAGAARRTTRLIPELTKRQSLIGAAAGLAILAAVVAFLLLRGGPGLEVPTATAESAGLGLAVLPFRVNDAELAEWREGMMDLLSTNLDGAAGLRTIDSRTVMARLEELAPREEAPDLPTQIAIGKQAGARYVLAGDAVAIGPEVRLSAEIYDAGDGSSLGSGQVQGPADSVFALVDRLSIEVLKAVLEVDAEDLPDVSLARVTTSSLPALKAYLEGEALYRRSQFEEAIAAYEKAVAADSTFALALYRIGIGYGWIENASSARAGAAFEQAARYAHRLPEREAILVDAALALHRGTLDGIEPMEKAVARYPDDPEVWYMNGEQVTHLGEQALLPMEGIERSFGQAIRLDPRFGPAYIHYIEAAFLQHADSALATERVAAYQELAAGSHTAERFQMALGIAFGDSATRTRAWAAIDTSSMALAALAIQTLGHPTLLEEQGRVLTAARRTPGPNPGAELFEIIQFMFNRIKTGRVGAALATLEESKQALPPGVPSILLYYAHFLGYPVPRERLDAAFATAIELYAEDDFPFVPEFGLQVGAWAAERGDWVAVEEIVGRVREASESSLQAGDSADARYGAGVVRALEGLTAWRHDDLERSIRLLESARRDATGHQIRHGGSELIRWSLGEILLEAGRPEDALRYFGSLTLNPMARFRAAKIYEELGRFEEAREGYAAALAAWSHADPEMRTLAEEARQGAIRLGGLRRG